ncbi:MAG: dihydrofolate reductase [Atopobiaceae bacterium]|jgi:dihydrofolate reductase|nr:dihydrofolate reductase [Olegusella sp.]MCI1934426.1 dihydrofolate reductase [Atopobiaceae bacterium]NLH91909.1 dihydrofolate reductase [Atopobium sp.]
MRAIVAVCKNWGIGKDGHLIVRNRADMKHFVSSTMGGTVVMGRKTLDSFSKGRPLKGRRNIVLTHREDFVREGVEVAHSIEEVLALVASCNPEQVWVIGGASVYRELLPYCSSAIVTKHECLCPADSFFPNLDESPSWHEASCESKGLTEENVPYAFVTYVHRS